MKLSKRFILGSVFCFALLALFVFSHFIQRSSAEPIPESIMTLQVSSNGIVFEEGEAGQTSPKKIKNSTSKGQRKQLTKAATTSEAEIIDELKKIGVDADHVSKDQEYYAFELAEADKEEDLNQDGDMSDEIIGFVDLATGDILTPVITGRYPIITGSMLIFFVPEWQVNQDLNNDSDISDDVIHVYQISSGEMLNTEKVVAGTPEIRNGKIFYLRHESLENLDFDADGKLEGYREQLIDIINQ